MAERAFGVDEERWPGNREHGDRSFKAILPPVDLSCSNPGFGRFGLEHALEGSGIGILDGLGIDLSLIHI